MSTKFCGKCGEMKPVFDFSKCAKRSDGLQTACKVCNAHYRTENHTRILQVAKDYNARPSTKAANKLWVSDNMALISSQRREKYGRRAPHFAGQQKQYRLRNPERTRETAKRYREKHPEKVRDASRNYMRKRLGQDLVFRTKARLRTAVYTALRRALSGKTSKTEELLGCSFAFFYQYFQAQFLPGMSWGNWGEWHLDHIRPVSRFNSLDPEQARLCNHYTNLQPLWAVDNLRKSNKYNEEVAS